MKFSELKLGDIVFYDQPFWKKASNYEDDVSVSHVAIVSHFTRSLDGESSDGESLDQQGFIPWLAHVSEKNSNALVMNPINISAYEYSEFRYLVYRLKYPTDHQIYAEKVAQTAKLWAMYNPGTQWVDKAYNKSIPTVPHAFSWLTAATSSIRSSRFGSGARSYVSYLRGLTEDNEGFGLNVPSQLTNSRLPFSGMSCSMFVISAYQAVLGDASAHLLALDARTTLPWTFEKYLRSRNRQNWKRLGYLDFYHEQKKANPGQIKANLG